MNFNLRLTIGLFCRALLITPFVIAILTAYGEMTEIQHLDNISVFLMIVLTVSTIVYLAIMTFIPAPYAIKTAISVIEFHSYKPQIVAIFLSASLMTILSLGLASVAFYWSAALFLAYALSLYMWPQFIARIDIASKEHMINSLQKN
jgi:hypothetical protein